MVWAFCSLFVSVVTSGCGVSYKASSMVADNESLIHGALHTQRRPGLVATSTSSGVAIGEYGMQHFSTACSDLHNAHC